MHIEDSWDDFHLRISGSDVTFGVLGPLEVRAGAELVHVGGPQIRALLALLLVRPGHVMSLSTLVASLWSSDAPPSAERTARTYTSRLRLALAPLAGRTPAGSLVVTAPPGYLLRADPMSVDASLFEHLALAGRRALTGNDPQAARTYLGKALQLWRGDAYAEFADVPLLRAEASRLEELRLSAVENHLQSELDMGLGPDLVAELDGLVAGYPLRERLWVQYLTALYRSGRQAEALSAYQRARALLADELGLEPSVELVDTHRRILAQDPTLLPELAGMALTAPAVLLATTPVAAGGGEGERALPGVPRQDLPPQEPPQGEFARQDLPRQDLPRQDLPRQEVSRQEVSRQEVSRQEVSRQDLPRKDLARADAELAAGHAGGSPPVQCWVRPQECRRGRPAPAGMRSTLIVIACLLARPRVLAVAAELGRILAALASKASALPVRVRAWWGGDAAESCQGYPRCSEGWRGRAAAGDGSR